ncbi:MAG: hypothetical protein K8W52_05945 [Deltaproteobacteria bacterium]|nr:hypothetical protein [Deltaproteobacteria bacterium]
MNASRASAVRAGLAIAAALGACVIPPSQSSGALVATAHGVGRRASIGAHSAALDDRGASVDLGAGWIVDEAPGRGTVHGTYAALARRVRGALWLGGRAELFWRVAPGEPRRALVARIALRRQLGGVRWGSGDGGGALGVLGALATGVFVDLGAHQLEGGGADLFASGGISLDLPALAGASR